MQLKLRLQGLPELLQQQLGQYHLVHNHNRGHPEKKFKYIDTWLFLNQLLVLFFLKII